MEQNIVINVYIYSHLTFYKGANNTHNEKTVFSINSIEKTGYTHAEE